MSCHGNKRLLYVPGNCETQEDLGLILIRHIRGDAFMLHERKAASFWWGEGDRGCPLDTGVVPWMWHANGTSRRILLTP
jgi:hypothetical protein